MTGTVFANRYTLTHRLGAGGTAEVFRGIDNDLGREVAVKIIHRQLLDDPVIVARVEEEVALTRGLDHPGIVRVQDLAKDGEQSAVILTYHPGGDLRQRILTQGPFTPDATRQLADSLLDALAYAHERGVVHRDVKPRNVLFDESGAPKLTDFGLARSMSSAGLSDRDSVAGTAEYSAPETITSSLWDPRSDLYALGCTLYEALVGQPPFVANTPSEVLRMHVQDEVPSLPGTIATEHPDLAITIMSLLAKDPNNRPQTAREAQQVLAGNQAYTIKPLTSLCPHCGSPMSDRYRWCFSCHKSSLPAVGKRRGGTLVMVTGPGRRGEKLSPSHRDLCSDAVEALGMDSGKMRKQVPRLPFVLARGLDRGSALRLRQDLAPRGVEVELFGPEDGTSSAAERMIIRKTMTMAPRVYLVMMGMSAGMINTYARMPPAIAATMFAAMLIGVPLATALSYRRGTARLPRDQQNTQPNALSELLVAVEDPLVHARIRSVVESGSELVSASQTDPMLDDEFKNQIAQMVEKATDQVARLGLALTRIREGQHYAQHAQALIRRAGSTGSEDSVSVVRKMDSLYTRTLEQIGSVALRIHESGLRLARSQQSLSRQDISRLDDTLLTLSDTSDAWTELSEQMRGDP